MKTTEVQTQKTVITINPQRQYVGNVVFQESSSKLILQSPPTRHPAPNDNTSSPHTTYHPTKCLDTITTYHRPPCLRESPRGATLHTRRSREREIEPDGHVLKTKAVRKRGQEAERMGCGFHGAAWALRRSCWSVLGGSALRLEWKLSLPRGLCCCAQDLSDVIRRLYSQALSHWTSFRELHWPLLLLSDGQAVNSLFGRAAEVIHPSKTEKIERIGTFDSIT